MIRDVSSDSEVHSASYLWLLSWCLKVGICPPTFDFEVRPRLSLADVDEDAVSRRVA